MSYFTSKYIYFEISIHFIPTLQLEICSVCMESVFSTDYVNNSQN